MELGGQEQEREMPSSLGYNPPHKDSSSKFSPANTVSGVRRDQTLNHHNHLYPQNHHPPNPHQSTNKPRREYQEADQDPFAVASPSPIAVATGGTSVSIKPHTEPPSPPQGQHTRSPTPQPQPATAIIFASTIRYRECLRNHAASMGGHVVDGCGEFMPSGEEGTPGYFRCAACECHRNFHRKEVEGEPQYTPSHYYSSNKTNGQRAALPPPQQHHAIPQPNPINLHHRFSYCITSAAATSTAAPTQPVMMAFGGGIPEESSSEDLTMIQHSDAVLRSTQLTSSKKRFRTKFTQQQKDKMMEFAEKLGWRIQKQDEQEVIQFCAEASVTRKAFKVWMHNNKQAMKKQQR
ncbi:zinc-finger homeodomain protein 6-like [Syzygium oleosum]|uniref:zinc-finger homeodomain protein 6-like n=1 Tax=Syzygium oleosum TaxID=219896 RepID=UPI0011D26B85|nr:zinc-finger homeodomain protein 6-like [Syzygium oleosum]XP_056170032.1 zinc-finger homeodomain protein 6-like [Syzygium oleosum]